MMKKRLLKNEIMRKNRLLAFCICISLIFVLGCKKEDTNMNTNETFWGPERKTFTMDNPASYPTFNSITDNPTIGDERDFVRIGEIKPDKTDLGNEVELISGKQYLVYVYFHNDSSSTFNDSGHDHKGVAIQTKMSVSFPNVVSPDAPGAIRGVIKAENAQPSSVWDTASVFSSNGEIHLRYVSGSAKIYNDWDTNNLILPSTLFSEDGTLIGLDELNGVIPGCEEYHGVVTFVLQAE